MFHRFGNPEGNIIYDHLGWTTISGIYIAHGGEKFIVIGNFNTYESTTIVEIGSGHEAAYYYIDEVVVEPYKNPVLDLGPDRLICEGEITVLNAGSGWDHYTWQDGHALQNYTAGVAGIYIVTTLKDTCTFVDSVIVNIQPTPEVDPWARHHFVFWGNCFTKYYSRSSYLEYGCAHPTDFGRNPRAVLVTNRYRSMPCA